MPKVAALACEALQRRHVQKRDIIIKGDNVQIIDGAQSAKLLHPGIWLIEG